MAERVYNAWKEHEEKMQPLLNLYSVDIEQEKIEKFVKVRNNITHNGFTGIDEDLANASFVRVDYYFIEQLLYIIGKMKDIQFILTSSPVKGDYKRVFCDKLKLFVNRSKDKERESDERTIIKYKLGKEIEEVEKRNVEFKEIKGNNPCTSIIDNAEIYINAFLNSQVSGIGTIKWGITDDGIVKGVELSKKDRDIIDRKVSERIGQIQPYVSTESIQITLEEAAYEVEIVRDLFVAEISVESVASKVLFMTSKNEVFIKTDGEKRRLNSLEIQQKLQRRLGVRCLPNG